ncbi:MAG: hypothetical protein DWQ31_18670 [Planctomycetota bacterium]|nr:MAG: hypothetical protein DWQ31_18670 [Planctomycetota bacterium]REJ88095.1 MAG: hypothetical protein DWQ35_20360 [Planctomycetota bacterium]REK21710.1 MAG: hypothetical protein DWQ42_18690 [Planctomycetota bacterium]REK43116.1 MAG: hypothetical protein DWQ46_12135 [Planctomycetota bacterium]
MKSANLLVAVALPLLLTGAMPTVIDGELTDGDARHPDRKSPMDIHEFETEGNQLLTVTLRPVGDTWDTYLYLTGPSGQPYSNDDSPDGNGGSLLRLVTPEGGLWEAVIAGYSEDSQGGYQMTVVRQGLNQVLREDGELTNDDQLLLKYGERADVMDMKVKAGRTYVAQMRSGSFDTFISIHVDGQVYSNDDTDAVNDGSQLIFTAQADGPARLIATSSGRDGRGRYSIRVFESVPVADE